MTGGAGGKGLGAFKQFRPSLELVFAEPLTRAAKMVPQQFFWAICKGPTFPPMPPFHPENSRFFSKSYDVHHLLVP